MKLADVLALPCKQEEFAAAVGISQPRVSQLVAEGVLPRAATAGTWLGEYCRRLREEAAGRASAGDLDLAQERAALAREQRIAIAMKNAVARKEFAPIGLLADVLGAASASVVALMDQLDGKVRRAAPDAPPEFMDAVREVLDNARNEWIRATAELVARRVDEISVDADDEILSTPDDTAAPAQEVMGG